MNDPYLIEALEELTQETGLESIGISNKTYISESNTIAQSQANTTIKLLITILHKLDALESYIKNLGIILNTEKYKTEINLEHLEANIVNLNKTLTTVSKTKQSPQDILGPKVIIGSKSSK